MCFSYEPCARRGLYLTSIRHADNLSGGNRDAVILSIEGNEATGKTALALTAPLPIVMFSLDMGSERALYGALYEKYFDGLKIQTHRYQPLKPGEKPPAYEGNDITVYQLPAPIQLDNMRLVGYMEQWDYFMQVYAKAIQDPNVATVVVDTMTLLRKNKCDAYLQELQQGGRARKQLTQIEYGHPDGAIRSLYTFAQSLGRNFIGIHHLRPHYVTIMRNGQEESVPDGTDEIDGVRDTQRYVDVGLRNVKDKDGKLKSRFIKCGPNLSYEGMEIPNMTWDRLVSMLETGWHGPKYQRRIAEVESGK